MEDRREGWLTCFKGVRDSSAENVAFIGLGDGKGTFETLVKFFQANQYAPQAAMYIDLNDRRFDDSNWEALSWLYDMWMVRTTWNATMPHEGPKHQHNPYAANRTDGDGTDLVRYMGGAGDFAVVAQQRLGAGSALSSYHAKAAATMLMLQMAVEKAPETHGFGLEFDHTDEDGHHAGWDPVEFNEAMTAMTFRHFGDRST